MKKLAKGIRIAQYDKDMKLLRIFPSMKQASIATKVSLSSISHCIHGRYGIAGGFIWRRYVINNEDRSYNKAFDEV